MSFFLFESDPFKVPQAVKYETYADKCMGVWFLFLKPMRIYAWVSGFFLTAISSPSEL